jgi:hypothetical protein
MTNCVSPECGNINSGEEEDMLEIRESRGCLQLSQILEEKQEHLKN